jgi:glycosyltransferase involved in cell wall biosynthesis
MSNHSSLSIVIPTYKRCKSVVALVNSIIPQIMDEDELLVVDDGSQDGTTDVLSKISRVRLISNSANEGMLKTWNKCLTAATNDWICMIHDDDTIEPDALKTIRKVIARVTEPTLIGHSYPEQNSNHLDTSLQYRSNDAGSWAALHPLAVPSGVTIHKEIIKAIGVFDERFQYSADIEYFSRVCTKFTSIVIENPRIVSFNLHSQNYEYKTWGKPDFLKQLEEIEKCIIDYAGLRGEKASEYFQNKMNSYIRYIMDNSYKSEDRDLLRKFCSEAKTRTYLHRRVLLSAIIASILNCNPKFYR